MPRVGNPKNRRRHFIKEWRLHRGLTQQTLADRLETTKANISRVETLKQGYTQDFLEACAEALGTTPASLIMRDPSKAEEDGIWSIWELAKPGERLQITEIARTITRPYPEAVKRARASR
jgi:transcriptional regulator with XRE-family HTH domain